MSGLLFFYLSALISFIYYESNVSHLQITLDIDMDYAAKADHAAIYGTSADWNQIMDARAYFWEGRR